MSDPFSVAANTVAVVALGLKVCQQLVKYYDSYKQSGSTVATMYNQLISLTKTLALIDRVLAGSALSADEGTRTKLMESIESCRVAVTNLEKKLTKILSSTQDGVTTGSKTKSFLHKASFPLRESTLVRLKEIILEFRGDLSLVLNVLQLDTAAISLQRLEGIDEKLLRVTDQVEDMSANVIGFGQDMEVISDILSANQIDEERQRIHEWLQPPDPFISHAAARSKHEKSTNGWFLEGPDFAQWFGSKTSLLLLYGIPGCGKTVLASTVIAELESRLGNKSILLYSYFDFNDCQKQTIHGCITSLLLQLALVTDDFHDIQLLYAECGGGRHPPSIEDLLDTFLCGLRKAREVYLVFDALDECSEEEAFINILCQILLAKNVNVRALITSRTRVDLDSKALAYKCIKIHNDAIATDIQTFVRTNLASGPRLAKWCRDESLQEELESALIGGSKGMFRLVACQLEELQKCLTIASLRRTLKALPKSLHETYDRITLQIDHTYHEMALQILQWLCVCQRPLTVGEAAETVTFEANEEGTARFDPANRLSDPSDVFIICSSLITSNHKSTDPREASQDTLSLAHHSVKEYLCSEKASAHSYRIKEKEAHAIVARSCLVYLLKLEVSERHRFHHLPLINYASQYWKIHFELAEGSRGHATLDSLIVQLLESEGAMVKLRQLEKPHYPPNYWTEKPGLHWAARFGLEKVATQLIQSGRDANAKDAEGTSALHDAVIWRKTAIVKLLLQHQVDLDCMDELGGSALHYAIYSQDDNMVRLLLEAGANPNIISRGSKAPLYSAAEYGKPSIVRSLLDYGSDPNVFGRAHVSELLSDKKSSSQGLTPLQAAAWAGHAEVTEMLLEAGATFDDKSLELLADGQVQEALSVVQASGRYPHMWHMVVPDYAKIASVFQRHANREYHLPHA